MREIKFRLIKEYSDKRVLAGYERLNASGYWQWMCPEINPDNGERWTHGVFSIGATYVRDQFTGKKCINGEPLYEGDIVFVEDNSGICLIRDDDDPEDVRYYMVIVWISEWCLFASLHIDEYKKYLKDGAESLDESMFWTYTIENSEVDFHYAGNIHQHPHLLEP